MEKQRITSFEIVEKRKEIFQSIDVLFQLLSPQAIEQHSFFDDTAEVIFSHATQVVLGEQRLACFMPQVYTKLSILDALDNQTHLADYILQVLTIAQVLDIVGTEMGIATNFYRDAEYITDRETYIPEAFGTQKKSTEAVAQLKPQLQRQATSLLAW